LRPLQEELTWQEELEEGKGRKKDQKEINSRGLRRRRIKMKLGGGGRKKDATLPGRVAKGRKGQRGQGSKPRERKGKRGTIVKGDQGEESYRCAAETK